MDLYPESARAGTKDLPRFRAWSSWRCFAALGTTVGFFLLIVFHVTTTMNESQAQTRAHRVIWLRRHRFVIQVFGAVIGGVVPPILTTGLHRLLQLVDLVGEVDAFAACFLVPFSVVLAIPGAIIGCGVANSITSQRVPYGYCRFCGYNLQQYTVPRCPECGKATVSEY